MWAGVRICDMSSQEPFYDLNQIGAASIFSSPPPSNLPARLSPTSEIVVYHRPARSAWKTTAVIVAFITGAATVLAAIGPPTIKKIFGPAKTHEENNKPAIVAATSKPIIKRRLISSTMPLRAQYLRGFIAKFEGCGYDRDAAFMLADLSGKARLQQVPTPAPPTVRIEIVPRTEGDLGEVAEAALPPIVVRPDRATLPMHTPYVATLDPDVTYRLNLQSFSTTTIRVSGRNTLEDRSSTEIGM